MFWFARATASSEINTIFPFDPALIPFALTAGVFLVLSGLTAVPAALFMVALELICLYVMFDRISRKKIYFRNFALMLAPGMLFIGVSASINALSQIGLSDLRPLLIARIAYEYDFNSRNLCFSNNDGKRTPLKSNEKVLFIGASQDRGIAASIKMLPAKPITQIKRKEVPALYPTEFHPVICNQP